MHVDWGWARQRPHHLAEELAKHGVQVRVLFKPSLRRGQLVSNQSNINRAPLVGSVVSEALDSPIMNALQQAQVLLWARTQPDFIWLSWPNLFEAVPPSILPRVRLVYDCMDLSQSFPRSSSWRLRTKTNEQRLLATMPVVFASSDPIASHLKSESPAAYVHIVPNGYDPSLDWSLTRERTKTNRNLVLGYFGTIAEWFDFDTVIKALDAIPCAELLLIGPATVSIPRHPRIRWLGPQAHAMLPSLTTSVDVFVMPFRITELISAVDPVKLYEYIASGRPVLARRYQAIERFTPHVVLYDSVVDFVTLLEHVDSGVTPPQAAARAAFLATNTWSARIDTILSVLNDNSRRAARPTPKGAADRE